MKDPGRDPYYTGDIPWCYELRSEHELGHLAGVLLFAEPPAEHIGIIRVVTSGSNDNNTNVKTVICRQQQLAIIPRNVQK